MSPAHSDRKRILCVEDDLDACEQIQVSLTLHHLEQYELVFATDLASGIQLAKGLHFDLYLIDDLLPDGAGLDLARWIRTFDSRTPLVIHSASAYAEDVRLGLEVGAQAYLTKPSDPNHIVEVIKTLVSPREARAMSAAGD
ncbi:MAG TPA: response regulator [Blastocatellia bacterium]|nr:response regulator [Blastocatellia bacterium]